MYNKQAYLAFAAVIISVPASWCLATVTPITRVTAHHPPGSPPYHL